MNFSPFQRHSPPPYLASCDHDPPFSVIWASSHTQLSQPLPILFFLLLIFCLWAFGMPASIHLCWVLMGLHTPLFETIRPKGSCISKVSSHDCQLNLSRKAYFLFRACAAGFCCSTTAAQGIQSSAGGAAPMVTNGGGGGCLHHGSCL